MLYVPICHTDFDESMFNISEMEPLAWEKEQMVKIIYRKSTTPVWKHHPQQNFHVFGHGPQSC